MHSKTIAAGLATPRRNPQSERDPRRQRKSASVRNNTFSHSQKILQIVDGRILLPSGQLRDGPLRDGKNEDDAPTEELDACDLFAQFADEVTGHIPTKSRYGLRQRSAFRQPLKTGFCLLNTCNVFPNSIALKYLRFDVPAEQDADEEGRILSMSRLSWLSEVTREREGTGTHFCMSPHSHGGTRGF